MRFIIIALTASILLGACTTQPNPNHTFLLNNISLYTASEETAQLVDSTGLAEYNSLKWNYLFQIPAFKQIKGNGYNLYVGVPFEASMERLIKSQTLENDSTLVQLESDQSSFYYLSHNSNDTIIKEYLVKIDQNLIHLLATTTSVSLADSLFNYDNLSKRIIAHQ